jgi:translation initiation factor RLI1
VIDRLAVPPENQSCVVDKHQGKWLIILSRKRFSIYAIENPECCIYNVVQAMPFSDVSHTALYVAHTQIQPLFIGELLCLVCTLITRKCESEDIICHVDVSVMRQLTSSCVIKLRLQADAVVS